jgi:hypothetical protein
LFLPAETRKNKARSERSKEKKAKVLAENQVLDAATRVANSERQLQYTAAPTKQQILGHARLMKNLGNLLRKEGHWDGGARMAELVLLGGDVEMADPASPGGGGAQGPEQGPSGGDVEMAEAPGGAEAQTTEHPTPDGKPSIPGGDVRGLVLADRALLLLASLWNALCHHTHDVQQ